MKTARLVSISKDGTEKRYCEWCGKMRADTYCASPKWTRKNRLEYMCRVCHNKIYEMVMKEAWRQEEQGIPMELRWLPVPVMQGYGSPLHEEIRKGLAAMTQSKAPVAAKA
jgi:hypothetical protein